MYVLINYQWKNARWPPICRSRIDWIGQCYEYNQDWNKTDNAEKTFDCLR